MDGKFARSVSMRSQGQLYPDFVVDSLASYSGGSVSEEILLPKLAGYSSRHFPRPSLLFRPCRLEIRGAPRVIRIPIEY